VLSAADQIVFLQSDHFVSESRAEFRAALSSLSARGENSSCNVTRFNNGTPVEGILCRISGTTPPKAPGRKPSA
jgi:hypothetical protein